MYICTSMHAVKVSIIIYISLFSLQSKAQITILAKDTATSFRGLCAVDDKTVWACGSKGWIAKSVDGKHFRFWQPKGYEKCEFRDVEAFDSNTAYVLAVTRPAIILKTTDGGNTWIETYRNEDTNIFLDAISFWDKEHGMAIGDPINGKAVLLHMYDGKNWKNWKTNFHFEPSESMFAASGTCMRAWGKKGFAFVTGGNVSRLYWQPDYADHESIIDIDTSLIQQGNAGAGAFSFCHFKYSPKYYASYCILVGGDYTKENLAEKNALIIEDGKLRKPKKLPNGYRECVEQAGNYYICCGPNGVDISKDGDVWDAYSKEGFHVVQKAKKGKKIFLAGGKGKIGVIGNGIK